MQTPRFLGFQLRFYRELGENRVYFGYKDKNEVETCVTAGCKSEHYDLRFADENKDSVFLCPMSGETFYGRGNVPAQKVYAIEMRKRADAVALQDVKAATAPIAPA